MVVCMVNLSNRYLWSAYSVVVIITIIMVSKKDMAMSCKGNSMLINALKTSLMQLQPSIGPVTMVKLLLLSSKFLFWSFKTKTK